MIISSVVPSGPTKANIYFLLINKVEAYTTLTALVNQLRGYIKSGNDRPDAVL